MTTNQIPSLPPMGAGLLLRALFKRGRGTAATLAGPIRTVFKLDGIERAQVRRYNALMGFAQDALPVTFYYLLAQRAHLATVLGPAFPFRVAGMIHVSNALEELGAVQDGQPLLLATTLHVRPPGSSGAVHCTLETLAGQQGRSVFSCSSEYLAVRGARHGAAKARPAEPALPAAIGNWELNGAAGRRYASVSGDWNPIHLSGWSARLMGLRAPIIHGMHTMGKACALLEARLGRRIVAISGRFTAPVPLPGEVLLAADLDAGTFVASSHGRPAVEGSFRTA